MPVSVFTVNKELNLPTKQPTLRSGTNTRAAARISIPRTYDIASWLTQLTPLPEVAKAITGA